MNTTQTQAPVHIPSRFGQPAEFQRRREGLERLDFPAGLHGRLQREQGWSAVFTDRVLGEYRRFLILAATSGRSVTPSRTVDHAWHAHLEYTRAYWDTLCGEVIGDPLHHTPGEPGDDAHFRQQYLDTLDLYRDVFAEAPPFECWPDPRRVFLHPRQAGHTSPRILGLLLLAGTLGLSYGLLSGGALLTLLGALLTAASVLLTWNDRAETSGSHRRMNAGGAENTGGGLLFAGLDVTGGSGDSGDHSGGDSGGHASCGSSCGSSCGGGCGS